MVFSDCVFHPLLVYSQCATVGGCGYLRRGSVAFALLFSMTIIINIINAFCGNGKTCEILKTRVIILLSFKQSTAVLHSSTISPIFDRSAKFSSTILISMGNQRTETQTSVQFSYIHKSSDVAKSDNATDTNPVKTHYMCLDDPNYSANICLILYNLYMDTIFFCFTSFNQNPTVLE